MPRKAKSSSRGTKRRQVSFRAPKGAMSKGRTRYIGGKGSYWTVAKAAYDAAAPSLKAASRGKLKPFLNRIGLGGKISNFLADKFTGITGYGDYSIKKNTLMGSDPAYMHSNGRSVRICHREYLADINGTVGFNANTFFLNPGLVSSFPWLSQIASQFQEYRWHGLVFEFKSTSSDLVSGSNTSMGSVIMGTQYNSALPAFVTKLQMENTEFSTDKKPSESFYHPVECDMTTAPLKNLYIRSGAVPAGQDQRFYDFCQTTIATQGMQTNITNVVGELWVSYEVELLLPSGVNVQGFEIATDSYLLGSAAAQGVTGTAIFGTVSPTIQAGSTLGTKINVTTPSAPVITFPAETVGDFFVFMDYAGSNGSITAPLVTYNNCTGLATISGLSTIVNAPQNGVSAGTYIQTQVVRIPYSNGSNNTLAPATLTYGSGSLPLAITGADLLITQINYGVTD